MAELPPLLTQLDVAALLGVSRQTLWRWAQAGVGPQPIRLGRMLRYRSADVAELVTKEAA